MNILTKLKIEQIKKSIGSDRKGSKNIYEENTLFFQNMMKKIKEIEREGILTERRRVKNEIQNSLNEIEMLNKNLKILEEEEINKKNDNILNINSKSKRNTIGNNSFYIPTLVKTFPELLYDKLNKNQSVEKENLKENVSFPLLIKDNNEQKNNGLIFQKKKNTSLINIRNYELDNTKEKRIINNYNYKKNSNYKSIFKDKKILKKNENNISSYTYRQINKKDSSNIEENENLDVTTKMYNKISNLSLEEKRENKMNNLMKEFIREKKNNYLDSLNEKKSKRYYRLLKNINSEERNMKVDNMVKVYNKSGIIMANETEKCFKEIQKINQNMKLNEKYLIRTLLIRK